MEQHSWVMMWSVGLIPDAAFMLDSGILLPDVSTYSSDMVMQSLLPAVGSVEETAYLCTIAGARYTTSEGSVQTPGVVGGEKGAKGNLC